MTPRATPTTTEQYRALEPEAAFQTWVIAYARLHRWQVAHINDSRRQDADGVQDLVLARDGVVYLIELKSASGTLGAKQRAWRAAAGAHGYVLKPGDRELVKALLT